MCRKPFGLYVVKSDNRGFALVKDAAGRVITSAAAPDTDITIEFRDGQRAAELKGKTL